eukprot:1156894-Pelagomonas_calceolata.AAC.5
MGAVAARLTAGRSTCGQCGFHAQTSNSTSTKVWLCLVVARPSGSNIDLCSVTEKECSWEFAQRALDKAINAVGGSTFSAHPPEKATPAQKKSRVQTTFSQCHHCRAGSAITLHLGGLLVILLSVSP